MSNDVLHEEDMSTMMNYTCGLLLDNDSVLKDETNIFQEGVIQEYHFII